MWGDALVCTFSVSSFADNIGDCITIRGPSRTQMEARLMTSSCRDSDEGIFPPVFKQMLPLFVFFFFFNNACLVMHVAVLFFFLAPYVLDGRWQLHFQSCSIGQADQKDAYLSAASSYLFCRFCRSVVIWHTFSHSPQSCTPAHAYNALFEHIWV